MKYSLKLLKGKIKNYTSKQEADKKNQRYLIDRKIHIYLVNK